MDAIQLQLVVPLHQPLSAGGDELSSACERFYEPFIERIESHPNLALTLHFGGHLLDFLSQHREDLLMRVRALHQARRIEVLSGLFYGGLPSLLPEADIRAQLQMGLEYWESLLGAAPTGVWLPELAWTHETPRFFSETDVLYSFGSESQLVRNVYPDRGLGVIERAGHGIASFILNDSLSRSLVGADVEGWVDAVVRTADGQASPVITVWIEGERLGHEIGTQTWAFERGWLDDFFTAISGGREEIHSVCPRDSFESERLVQPLRFVPGCAHAVEPDAIGSHPVDWPDFAHFFPEVDTLFRRMLRMSEKLRDTVATMEEEGLDGEWGDQLATAQRLVFSAQSPDAYWRGRRPGFSDPKNRSAAYARLIEAEVMIDSLVQGDDDFIAAELEDRDGDLDDEVFVTTRYFTVWLSPAQGGRIRTIDDRINMVQILDAPPRRAENFFHRVSEAPYATTTEIEARGPLGALQPLPRLEPELALDSDRSERQGIRDWILDDGASAGELYSGSALDLTPEIVDWNDLLNEIDENGDLTYQLDLEAQMALGGVSRRVIQLQKKIRIPIDEPEIHFHYSVGSESTKGFVLATEFPIRLMDCKLRVDDRVFEPSQSEFHEVKEIEIVAQDESVVRIKFSRPIELWADRIRTTVKDVHGYRSEDQGLSLVFISRIEGQSELSFTTRLLPAPSATEAQ